MATQIHKLINRRHGNIRKSDYIPVNEHNNDGRCTKKRSKPLNFPRVHWFLSLFRDDIYASDSESRRRGSLEDQRRSSILPKLLKFSIYKYTATIVITCIFVFALLVRWLVSLNNYSGKGVSPLYGDFEAQRHWLEITTGLPISQWYYYDKEYWPLDYPPLTAYHSYFFGLLAHLTDKSWVELYTSRGIENETIKTFMRSTVLISDLLIYFSGCYQFVNTYLPNRGNRKQISSYSGQTLLILLLINAPMIIIDHGHFQYNCVMLGSTLWSVSFLLQNRFILSSFFFCLALLFKQMALFYALPFFFVILSVAAKRAFGPIYKTEWYQKLRNSKKESLHQSDYSSQADESDTYTDASRQTIIDQDAFYLEDDIGKSYSNAYYSDLQEDSSVQSGDNAIEHNKHKKKLFPPLLETAFFLFKVGIVVILTFALTLAPFVIFGTNGVKSDLYQIFRRVFPVHRGLFEDKVSNFWCAINIFIKIRNLASLSNLMVLSILFTLISTLPSSIHLFIYPSKKNFLYALLNSSLGFYMFSFQVHEKSILLPLLPASMLSLDDPQVTMWFTNVAMYSMYPLLKRDELIMSFILLLWLTNFIFGGGIAVVGSIRSPKKVFISTDLGSQTNGVISTYTTLVDRVLLTRITNSIKNSNNTILRLIRRVDEWATWGTLIRSWYLIAILVFILEMFIKPPARYPDLFVVLNLELSFLAFIFILVYFNIRQLAHKIN